jgi:competence protein ComEC
MSAVPPDFEPPKPRPAGWREFASAPLLTPAVAATAGLCLDRTLGVTADAAVAVGALAVIARAFARSPLAVNVTVALLFGAVAAGYHHQHRHDFPPDDLGRNLTLEMQLVRVRGVLADDPVRLRPNAGPLAHASQTPTDAVPLDVTAVKTPGGWQPASGRLRLFAPSGDAGSPPMGGLRLGDEVEVFGPARRSGPPRNPGERDQRAALLDQRIRGDLALRDAGTVTKIGEFPAGPAGWVAAVRRHAVGAIRDAVPEREAGAAAALLVGDGSALDSAAWEQYRRTGVVHVLAISGQHLAVVAGFLWLILRLLGVRRARSAAVVLLLVVAYTAVTGARPSAVRACVMVAAACGGMLVRRPTHAANAFLLAWLAVIALNPTDPFTLGCELSFLAVFTLVWGLSPLLTPAPLSPLEQLIDESRPHSARLARRGLRLVVNAYAVTLGILTVTAPLVLADQNVVSPVGLLVGPLVVALASLALLLGLLMLLASPLTPLLGIPVGLTLAACGALVATADRLPGGVAYLPGPPAWWLAGFYLGVAVLILGEAAHRRRVAVALMAWVMLAVILPAKSDPRGELRVTFLAVGKGGCVVLETPDGRCLIYDTGTTAGPGAVRRIVAPYLWSRGIDRVDELFLSHADADHFNGVAELLARFPVGQVTLTPSFAEKPTAEVVAALSAFRGFKVPTRLAHAGMLFTTGEVTLEVLHPPRHGPPGIENERSLVLLVTHGSHRVLLTGDLEKGGTAAVITKPIDPVDVLMAPHHGSRGAAPRSLADWCRPKFVAVSRGPALGNSLTPADLPGATVWDTDAVGAITVVSGPTGLTAAAFLTGERHVVRRGGP